MFTGIIQATGKIDAVESTSRNATDVRLHVDVGGDLLGVITPGDSIAVNGVCLTASSVSTNGFMADVSAETLSCTTLGSFRNGTPVNLETAVTPTTALGGHLVSGHVDGVGEVMERRDDARSVRMQIRVPNPLARYIAPKGSITVDGVSLTVNAVTNESFTVNIVPHTLEVTIMGSYEPGDPVNLEVDLVARYLERLLEFTGGAG